LANFHYKLNLAMLSIGLTGPCFWFFFWPTFSQCTQWKPKCSCIWQAFTTTHLSDDLGSSRALAAPFFEGWRGIPVSRHSRIPVPQYPGNPAYRYPHANQSLSRQIKWVSLSGEHHRISIPDASGFVYGRVYGSFRMPDVQTWMETFNWDTVWGIYYIAHSAGKWNQI